MQTHIYIYIYIYVCVCVSIYMYAATHTCAQMRKHIYSCAYALIYVFFKYIESTYKAYTQTKIV